MKTPMKKVEIENAVKQILKYDKSYLCVYSVFKKTTLANENDFVCLKDIDVVNSTLIGSSAPKSIKIKLDILDPNCQKYNGQDAECNSTGLRILLDGCRKIWDSRIEVK